MFRSFLIGLILCGCASLPRQPQSDPNEEICGTFSGKLLNQFRIFDEARKTWFKKIETEKLSFSSDDWNAMLAVQGNCIISADEMKTLAAQQESVVRIAKAAAIEESVIKIDDVFRTQSDTVKKFCAALPKGGMLHEHANGTMNRETVDRLFTSLNPDIDMTYVLESSKKPVVELNAEERLFLAALAAAHPKGSFSAFSEIEKKGFKDLFFLPKIPFVQTFKRFSFPFFIFPLLRNSDEEQLTDFLLRARRMGVRYVEVTKNPKFGLEAKTTDPVALDKIHDLAGRLFKKTQVVIHWNYAFFRTDDPVKNGVKIHDLLKTLEKKPIPEIVGIDLLADEELFPALSAGQSVYGPVMASVIEPTDPLHVPLHRTFHAGELGASQNVRDAIVMGAERVGHGVRLQDDLVTLEYARTIGLAIEVNPISNLRLGVVKSLKYHPFLKFLRLGLNVSLSTDDEGVLETDINNECSHIVQETDVTYAELKKMAFNSIRTSFATEDEKNGLLKDVAGDFEEFEKNWRTPSKSIPQAK